MNKNPKELAEIYAKAAFDSVITVWKANGPDNPNPISEAIILARVGVSDTTYVDGEGTLFLRQQDGRLKKYPTLKDNLNIKLIEHARERAKLGYDQSLVDTARSYAEQMEPAEKGEFFRGLEEKIEERVRRITPQGCRTNVSEMMLKILEGRGEKIMKIQDIRVEKIRREIAKISSQYVQE